jgi:hypothetical protein
MDFINLIFWIIGVIMLWRMINLAFALGTRIAVASETTALHMAALFKTLSPEAQARANAAFEHIVAETRAAPVAAKPRSNTTRRVDATSTF